MPENLLTARQVEDSFGFARTTLLRWEADGKIKPARTPGGQRRYDRKDIERALAGTASPSAVAAPERPRWNELGESGYSRWLEDREEPLRELAMGSVSRWKLLREMRLNDPVIYATFFAIESSLKQATWRVAPASESEADKECAEFIETCLHDMSQPWIDVLDHILLMLEQGVSPMEIVYKRRLGPNPPSYTDDPAESAYSDGRIGWRKWASRPVETLTSGDEFVMDEKGSIQGINQWTEKGSKFIPIERLLIFRTTVVPANTPWGRALTLDTEIPTPDGWTTMREIKAGDKVYGSDGKIRYVTWKSPVWQNRPVYKLTFSNGQTVIADENHLWKVTTNNDRCLAKPERTLTTKAIYEWFASSKNPSKICFSFGKSPVIDGQIMALPLDPYILGYWLGDGYNASSNFGVCEKDFENFRVHCESAGYEVSYDGKIDAYVKDIKSILRRLNLFGNKHIPQPYLRANPEQRLALLQGLMDTDGYTHQTDSSVFTNTNELLVSQVEELVSSLGIIRRTTHKRVDDRERFIDGRRIRMNKPLYSVAFKSYLPIHRLQRKLINQTPPTFPRTQEHILAKIEYLSEPMDTACIEVDAPDHMFLVTRSMIPTHNSIHRGMYTSWYMKRNFQEIEGIGVERDLAGVPVVYLGNDCTTSGPYSDFELAKDLVVNLRKDEQAGIVIPHPKMGAGAAEGQGMLIELLSAGGARAHDIGAIVERYDRRMALSVLTQFIMLGLDRTGSYALSRNQNDLFVLAISAWLQKIADVINRIAIPRLVRYNVFPDITGMPKIQPSEVGIPDLEAVANFVNQLVGREVIQPDPELERHLRQMARLPERKVTEGTDATPVKPKHDAMDTALVLRRVLLALKELPTYEGLTDEQLIAMLDPLLSQLKLAIEAETGQTIAVPDTDLLADNANSPNITARTNAARNGSDDVVTADADSAADDEQRRPVNRQRAVR